MRVHPYFAGAFVKPELKERKAKDAEEIETALKMPVNQALSQLLDTINADEGGTHVEFYEQADSMHATELMLIPTDFPGEARARIVVGQGENRTVLSDHVAPESKSRGFFRMFSASVGLTEYVTQVLSEAVKKGVFHQNSKPTAKKG